MADETGDDSAGQSNDEEWELACADVELDDVRFCVDHSTDANYDSVCDMDPEDYSALFACHIANCVKWFGEGCVRAYMNSAEYKEKFPNYEFAVVPVAPGQTQEQALSNWATQGATTEPLVATNASPSEQIAERWRVGLVALGIGAGALLLGVVGKIIQGIASAGRTIAGFGIVIVPFLPCVQGLVSDYDVFTAIQICADGGTPPTSRL